VKKNLLIAILMTVVTTVLLGIIYPLVVTGLAQLMFRDKSNGQLIVNGGTTIGSRIIGQPFTGDAYFHSRPSAAGNGYDAANSGGSNLGPTNSKLVQTVEDRVKAEQVGDRPVPVELVTSSASGLDPELSPGATLYQAPRVAKARGITEDQLNALVRKFIQGRQLGILGEPRVNVLELNLALDREYPLSTQAANR
jgi:potassium-transporting ATPase KdpC subunit